MGTAVYREEQPAYVEGMKRSLWSVGVAVSMLVAGVAKADDGLKWFDGGEAPLFPKGSQDFSLVGAFAYPFQYNNKHPDQFGGEDEKFAQITEQYGYNLLDNLALVPKLTEDYVFSDQHDSVGVDFFLTLRWHLLQVDDWTVFLQGGGGLAYFTRRVPEDTTNFNFGAQIGPGFTYKLGENLHLMGGVDWLHFSNAEIAGAERHGASNTVQTYVGLMWTF